MARWIEALRGPGGQALAAALGVFLFASVSLQLAAPWGRIAPIWPANAIGAALLLGSGRRRWPGFMLAFLAGDLAANLWIGDSLVVAGGLAAVNTFEAASCAAVTTAVTGRRPDIRRPFDLAVFGMAAGLSAAIAGVLAEGVLTFAAHASPFSVMGIWGLADALGLLIFTPALILAGDGGLDRLLSPQLLPRTASVAAFLTAAILLSAVLPQHPIMMFGSLVLVFAAIQLEFAGAAVALTVMTIAAVCFVAVGWRPLPMASFAGPAQAFWLQAYLLFCALVTFPVASVLARRRDLERELTASRDVAQEAMRQAELAERISGVGHWRSDYVLGTLTWSRQMYAIYGMDPADGPPPMSVTMDRCHPDDRDKLLRHREQHRRDDADAVSVRIVRPDGEIRHVIANGAAIRDASGAIVGRMGTLSDVTELKRAEAAAQENEKRYRFLAENAPDMISRTSLTGEVLYISPSSARVLGYTPEEMARLNAQTMVHPDDFERVMKGIFSLIEERAERLPEPLCYRARHKDGRWIWIETNPTLTFDPLTGEPIEFIDIVRDVTQTKTFEAELDEARRRAEDAAAAKSAFLANMSHELRTPLTSIIGFSRLMSERQDLSAETMHYAKRISDASEALLAIINDVLDFSKLEAGQVTLELQPFSVRRLVEETTGLIAIQAAAKGLQVRSGIDPAMPGEVIGDVARLRQVLLNFLSNAVKFTPSGTVTVTVGWTPDGDGGRMRLSVADTGPGISAEGVARLFERFSQAEVSINRTHGGTGLGLAICKGIIGLMRGEIGVDTAPGEGSTFWFEIPAAAAVSAPVDAGPAVALDCPRLRLLVVDDTPVNRELVKLMLVPMGLEVEEAAGGAEGVKAALAKPFDMILMDVRMPGVDGLEATRVIRADSAFNASTPILALTADVQPENFAACRSAGMNDVVAKPISPVELVSKIAQWAPARDAPVRAEAARA